MSKNCTFYDNFPLSLFCKEWIRMYCFGLGLLGMALKRVRVRRRKTMFFFHLKLHKKLIFNRFGIKRLYNKISGIVSMFQWLSVTLKLFLKVILRTHGLRFSFPLKRVEIWIAKEILNLKRNKKCMIGSKVREILI